MSPDALEALQAAMPKMPPMLDSSLLRCMVVRGNDNGQIFIVEEGLSVAQATALYDKLIRGHKQWYLILQYFPWDRAGLIALYNLRI